MENLEEEILLCIALIIARYAVLIGMTICTVRSFSAKKYLTVIIFLSIVVSFFSMIFYQTSTKTIATEFGNVAYVKMPVQYKVLEKEMEFLLIKYYTNESSFLSFIYSDSLL
ncbi:hypothetical protein [Pinibacter aurantiacus]|uniref:Uncharacterized protein n=1 Tax=Pinibacter aurantiacus TaxID=2851599 RepID=A0A9E2SC66_9BACT|nr:hypothetical protein [Pinibacter aurantiacus]MBV4357205.1 hypothetical protein [Pinibacter aurantiacus]